MKLRGTRTGAIIWNDIPFTDSVVTLPPGRPVRPLDELIRDVNATTGTYAFDMELIVK